MVKIKLPELLFKLQLAMVASLPFHFLMSSYLIVFSLLVFIIFAIKDSSFFRTSFTSFFHNRVTQALLLYYIITLGSFLIHYLLTPYNQLFPLEQLLPFVLLPLLFSNIINYKKRQVFLIFKSFVLGVLISTFYALSTGIYHSILDGNFLHPSFPNTLLRNITYHQLGSYVGVHAIYLSLYSYISLLLVFSFGYKNFFNLTKGRRKILLVLIAYFILILALLKSAIFLSILTISLLWVIYILYTGFSNKFRGSHKAILSLAIGVIIIGITVRVYSKISSSKNYFTYEFSQKYYWNSINLRLAKWHIALLAIEDHWILGVGPGNEYNTLDKYYIENEFYNALENHYNPHNQFLHTFLALGIVGLFALGNIYYMMLRSAVSKKDYLALVVIISFMIFSLTESTLAVNKGIVFISMFGSIIAYMPSPLISYLSSQEK